MKYRRRYYGWYDQTEKEFRLSLLPPDSPVRKISLRFQSLDEVTEALRRKRADVYWWPPLPLEAQQTLSPNPFGLAHAHSLS